jgi:hypothetical protein
VLNKGAILENSPVFIDFKAMTKHIEKNDIFYNKVNKYLLKHKQPFCLTCYEDLASDSEQIKLLEFIGVSNISCTLTPKNKKQGGGNFKSRISNYEELKERCKDTRFGKDFL